MAVVSKLTDVVSAEEIRALLGVTAKELSDERVDLPIYLKIVKSSVGALDTERRIWATYEALPDSGLTDEQTRFQDAFRTYVAVRAAMAISISLPGMGFRSLTDGKASVTRESNSAELIIGNLQLALEEAAQELVNAAAALLPSLPVTATVGLFFGTATPGGTDPVTGA